MPSYTRPNVLHILDKIPLTPHGKVDRRALANIMANELLGKKEHTPTGNTGAKTFSFSLPFPFSLSPPPPPHPYSASTFCIFILVGSNKHHTDALTSEEKMLSKVWEDTFGSAPDLDKGFLEQGDSLSLMQFHAVLQGSTKSKVPITDLLSYPIKFSFFLVSSFLFFLLFT